MRPNSIELTLLLFLLIWNFPGLERDVITSLEL